MGQDTKRLITGMVVALAVLMAYNYALQYFYPNWKPGETPAPTPPPAQVATTAPVTTGPTTVATTGATTQGTAIVAAPASQGIWQARGGEGTAKSSKLGSEIADDKGFRMALALSRRGAGIDSVVLNKFRKTAEHALPLYTFQEPYQIDGGVREDSRALLTRRINVDGNDIDLSNVDWRLEASDASSATFAVDILKGGAPVAKFTKTYKLSPRSEDAKTAQGYEVTVSQRVENLSVAPIYVKTSFNGPTAPPRELESQPDQNIIAGYWNDGIVKVYSHLISGEFNKDSAFKEYTKSEKGLPDVWAGTQSAYFNAIVRPVPMAAGTSTPDWITKIYGELLNPHAADANQHHVSLRFEADLKTIAPGAAAQADMDVYFGPKWREVLKTDFYTGGTRQYDQTLVISGGWCGICTWQWMINILVWMLTAFHFVTRDWGLAIIGLVLVVRALLHPITEKSQVHMMKMQKMGPEMEKLKKKYADDKDALAKAQMQFYKEQGMTPILGCLPMFLQMPIWIALWNSLQSTFELRHAPFLYGFTWIHDLSKPDYLIHFSKPYEILFFHVSGLNILPLLLAVVFYLQTKMQPKPANMTPEQLQQQKMMTWMTTLLFPFMLYTGPSGLNLYIMTSTAFGILESKVIRKHIKEREELEALGPTIIDAPPPAKGGKAPKEEPKPKNWLAKLQERAEQIRKDAQKPKR